MKILFVQESDWLAKGPHQQHHLADRLSLRGHWIRVIDHEILWRARGRSHLWSRRQVFPRTSKVFDDAKITVIRPGIIKVAYLDYLSLLITHRQEIARQMEEFEPDVIVGFGILNASLAARAARMHSIPFVYYWIDVLHRLIPSETLQPLGRMLETRTLRRADRILVINERLGEYVIGAGAPPDRTSVLRAGVDIGGWSALADADAVRRQCSIKERDIVLLFVGWLYSFSGLKEVAQSLAKGGNPGVKLLVVGEGEAFHDLQEIQNEYSLHERLILTGKRPYHEIPSFVAAADVCILPAYPTEKIMRDIVPIKMYEYMALGRPVVSTRLDGVAREFGENNGVVYVENPDDVFPAAVELVKDGKSIELGLRARRFVEKLTWESTVDEFERMLEQVSSEFKHSRAKEPAVGQAT